MGKPIDIIFKFGDGATHDASESEASQSQLVCFKYGWSLAPLVAGLDADPKYTIEVSNDDTTWSPYDSRVDDVSVLQPFDDTHLNWKYVRINYNADTNTTGTVNFPLVLK